MVGRAGEHGKQALSRVLKSLGQANPEIAEILLEFCITELEDVVAEVCRSLFFLFFLLQDILTNPCETGIF